ncbi:hypothetical protein ACL4BT_04805 [Vibrio alginolyticus]
MIVLETEVQNVNVKTLTLRHFAVSHVPVSNFVTSLQLTSLKKSSFLLITLATALAHSKTTKSPLVISRLAITSFALNLTSMKFYVVS